MHGAGCKLAWPSLACDECAQNQAQNQAFLATPHACICAYQALCTLQARLGSAHASCTPSAHAECVCLALLVLHGDALGLGLLGLGALGDVDGQHALVCGQGADGGELVSGGGKGRGGEGRGGERVSWGNREMYKVRIPMPAHSGRGDR